MYRILWASRACAPIIRSARGRIAQVPVRCIVRSSVSNGVSPARSGLKFAVTALTLISGGIVGCYIYLDKTSKFRLLEYARTHRNKALKGSNWRDCFAVALVDLYRNDSGARVIERMHCGRILGKWVADDEICTSEIMTVLLLLSNADGICLIDAITTGGIAVLKKLYEFNRSDCESAIIQMIKYKISYTCILYEMHLY